jgi:ERCC4-type nuclease
MAHFENKTDNVNVTIDNINTKDELTTNVNISSNVGILCNDNTLHSTNTATNIVEILIDNREHAMIEMLNEEKCPIIVSQLDIGDIQYRYAGELKLIIERKSINDLVASVKDGRYKEQKFRLVHASNSARIMYIIEGKINKDKNSKLVWGAILNTMIRDNIKVIRTFSIEETVFLVSKLKEKVTTLMLNNSSNANNANNEINNTNSISVEGNYTETIKSKKGKNITPTFCFIAQLCQIPSISDKIATPIVNKYTTMQNLISAYQPLTEKERKKLLATIEINEKRKVGKLTSEKIYNYLFGNV